MPMDLLTVVAMATSIVAPFSARREIILCSVIFVKGQGVFPKVPEGFLFFGLMRRSRIGDHYDLPILWSMCTDKVVSILLEIGRAHV